MHADYLDEVSTRWRRLAIIGLSFASLMFVPAFLFALIQVIFFLPANPEKAHQLIGQAVVGGIFSGASLWPLLRLLCGRRARNGLTVMPLWFIEVAGLILLVGLLAYAIENEEMWLLIKSIPVFGAMIFIRWKVRAKLRRMQEAELRESPESGGDDLAAEDDHPLDADRASRGSIGGQGSNRARPSQ